MSHLSNRQVLEKYRLATAGLRSIVRPSGGASGRPSPPRRHPLTVGAAGPEEGLVALPADQGTDVGGTLVAITAPPTAGYIPHLAASAPESVVHRLDLAEQSLAQERSLRGAMQGQLEEQGSRLQEQDEAIDQLVQLASELHTRQRDQSKRISSMMAAAGIAVTATADAGVATGVDTKPGEAWQAQLSQQVLKLEGRLDTLEQQQQHVPPEVSELARRLDALEQQQQQQQQQPPPPPSPQRRQRQQDTTTTARAPSRSQAAARPTYHQSTWSQRNEQTRSQAARRIQRQFRRYMDEQLAAAEAQLELIEAQRRRRLQQEEEEEEQRQLNALLLQDMQNGAATEVQRWWRGGVARGLRRRLLAQERQRVAVAAAARRSELERERRREEEEEVQAEVELRLLAEAERMLAATDIQRAFRGLLERRRHKQQLAGTATAVAASAQQGSLGGPAGGAGPEGLDPESFATYLDENSFSEQDQARAKALADAARSSASQQAGIGVSWSDDDDEVDEDDVLPPIGPPHIPAQLLNELAESGVELQGVDGGIDWKHQWEQIALERQGHRLQQQPPPPPPHSTAIATRGAAGGYASASVRFATEADATRLISPRDESTGSEYDVLDFSGDDGLLAAAAGDDAGAAAAATLEEHVMATALQAAFRGFAARLAVGRMRRDDGNHADAADDTDDDVQEPQHRQQPPVSGHSSLAGSHATASRQSTTQRRRPTRRPAKGKGRPKLLAPTKSPPTDTEAAKLAAARASQIRAAAATLEQRGSSATGMNSAGAAAAGKVAAVTTRAVDVTEAVKENALFQRMRAAADQEEEERAAFAAAEAAAAAAEEEEEKAEAEAVQGSEDPWQPAADEAGRVYYHNVYTGAVAWERPPINRAERPGDDEGFAAVQLMTPREGESGGRVGWPDEEVSGVGLPTEPGIEGVELQAGSAAVEVMEPPPSSDWPSGILYNPQSRWLIYYCEPNRRGDYFFVRQPLETDTKDTEVLTEWEMPAEGVRGIGD